jgi:hypothetical protein
LSRWSGADARPDPDVDAIIDALTVVVVTVTVF